ncbi:MAG: HPr family phosphocarrier protein [Bacteroidales bacterium]|nr:HPr family phosphocarrier protein [Bacteroidales bacterium]
MLSSKVLLSAPSGLHARPAGELVKLVKGFAGSKVRIATPAKSVDAASMLGLLSLGLKSGSELEVSVEGGDEAAVLQAVSSFISSIGE